MKLINHLFKNFMYETFRIFFEGLEKKFCQEIAINLYPRKFQDKEEIISVDQGSKNLYFLVKGKVSICSKDGSIAYVDLPHNTYFGDYLIFFRLRSSNAFISDGESEVLCIKKKKFLEICDMFPNAAKQLKYRAFLRRKFIRKTKKAVEEFNEKRITEEEKDKNPNFLNEIMKGSSGNTTNKVINEPSILNFIRLG
jgi:signal-transduction protein with cAMP-binding, CBS, and nucleotidyltransferase domain